MMEQERPSESTRKAEYKALLKQKEQIETAKKIGMKPETLRKLIDLYKDDLETYKARYE